jgi:MoaD family protein
MVMVTVKVLGLSHLTDGEKEIHLEAIDIMDLLEKMKDRYVQFKQKAFLSDDKLHPRIRIIINGKSTNDHTYKLKHGEVVMILPIFAGG